MAGKKPSWEAADFRCPVCMCLFETEEGGSGFPFFICENHHSLCRDCITEVKHTVSPACPECRSSIVVNPTPNRIIVQFMQRVTQACGACDLQNELNITEMHAHAPECPEAFVTCCMGSNNNAGNLCGRKMRQTMMWDHCISEHALTPVTTITFTSNNIILTGHISPNSNSNIAYFIAIRGDMQTKWSLEITRRVILHVNTLFY